MARFRLSRLAQTDLARILATSAERWGIEGRRRYAAMLADAIRKVAAEPEGPTTRARSELAPGTLTKARGYDSRCSGISVRIRCLKSMAAGENSARKTKGSDKTNSILGGAADLGLLDLQKHFCHPGQVRRARRTQNTSGLLKADALIPPERLTVAP